MNTLILGALAITGAVAQVNKFTATSSQAVHAAQATAKTSHETSHVRGRAFDRFITVWFENTDFDKAAGDPHFAALAKKGITLTNYYSVTHPSEPNYVASHGGDNFGMDNDDFNQIVANVSTVTDLLEDKGISWGSYQQHMPFTGFEGFAWVNQTTLANDYVRKHNPPVIYNANTTPERLTFQKNFTEFHKDLRAQTLPQWMFITPNMTDDGHDTSVTVAGDFLQSFFEPLLENEYFMERTLILVTFDENHTFTIPNRVFSILLGGAVPESLHGTTDDNYYNHYSEISTVEANWDLHTLGRWDVGANVFSLVAEKTGDILRPNTKVTGANPSVFQNSSFAGPFNDDFAKAPYPAPNLEIRSPRTGRTVLPAIVEKWTCKDSRSGHDDDHHGFPHGFPHGDPHKEGGNDCFAKTIYTDSVEIPDGQHPPPGFAVNDVDN